MMFKILIPAILLVIYGLPLVVALFPPMILGNDFMKISLLFLAPFVFSFCFLLMSGLISRPFQRAIVVGKFPRDLTHPVYGARRLYGLCWTAVFYFSPIYHAVLSAPFLKKLVFRLFGYKGSLNFIAYPDTWIRDLPILELGEGVYLSNKATIGTNICLKNGSVLVDKIQIEKNGMVGHLSMLAPGVYLGESTEIGVGCAIGIRTAVHGNSKIAPSTTLNHGVVVGKNCTIGTSSYVGIRTVIRDDIQIPAGANIPAGSIINTQKDVETYYTSETESLQSLRKKMEKILFTDVALAQ